MIHSLDKLCIMTFSSCISMHFSDYHSGVPTHFQPHEAFRFNKCMYCTEWAERMGLTAGGAREVALPILWSTWFAVRLRHPPARRPTARRGAAFLSFALLLFSLFLSCSLSLSFCHHTTDLLRSSNLLLGWFHAYYLYHHLMNLAIRHLDEPWGPPSHLICIYV